MPALVQRVLLAVAALTFFSACGSKSASVTADAAAPRAGAGGAGGASGGAGGGGAGGAGAGGAAGMPADAAPPASATPPKDCRGLRDCVFACDKDAACVTRCVSTAPATAKALYDMIRACSTQACPDQDISCRCDQECYGAGQCFELVIDMCDGSDPDKFCDPTGATCGI